MTTKYIMALDAGTTGIRAIIYNSDVEIVGEASQEFTQIYPKPGWVEHDPMEIWNTQLAVARRALLGANIDPHDIGAIGVTNQRETTVIWDRGTGKPIMNAIVWQDRRTAGACDGLKEKGLEDHVRSTTGLVIDAYFSGTKIAWMLDNVPGARVRAEAGELCFGTIDSWLIWNLTAGAAHVTDYSNAARTMLFNINTLDWDDKLLTEIGVPRLILPEVRPSSEIYGYTCDGIFAGAHIPVAAAIVDEQDAVF